MKPRRLVALVLCAGVAVVGFNQFQDDNVSSDSGKSNTHTSTSHADGVIDPEVVRCANLRAAWDGMKATKAERKLPASKQLIISYGRMQVFYTKFAQIFPESAPAANELNTIYAHARKGPLPTAEEAKIGGLDDKIGAVIDKHCPNSGYPAN